MKISKFPTDEYKNKGRSYSFKALPDKTIFYPEVVGDIGKWAGEYVSMPEQKLFLATSALMFQPLIDLKFANNDKKIDSSIKSASKAIAGGLTGVTIRALFLKLTDHCIQFDKDNKLQEYFFPADVKALAEKNPGLATLRLNAYNKTLGSLFAVLFMILYSNSKLDVPLTNDLQDLFSGVIKQDKTWLQSLSDVSQSRGKKIQKWLNKKKDYIIQVKTKIEKITGIIAEKPPSKTTEAPK